MMLAAIFSAVVCCSWPFDRTVKASMDVRLATARAYATEYDRERRIDDLERAADFLSAISMDALSMRNFVAYRREVVDANADVLQRIEAADADVHRKSAQIRMVCLDPPMSMAVNYWYFGKPYCIARRRAITEAEFWRAYQSQMARINTDTARVFRVERLDELVMAGLEASLSWFCELSPGGMPSDDRTLLAIVDRHGLSKAHRDRIEGRLCLPHGPL